MAFETKLELPGAVPSHCGGEQRPWIKGTKTISGTTKVNGVASSCRVYLTEATGALRGFRRTDNAGTYRFIGLAPGKYMLLIQDDQQNAWRPKVELVDVT